MKATHVLAAAAALTLTSATFGQVVIEALDLRSTGVFGHPDATAGTINAGPGAPTDITITYANLDIDGDSTANDSVTFTVNFLAPANNQRLFNQGADTGFGNITDLTVSVTGVVGTTTDGGTPIVFDGFTGAALGAGTGGGNDVNATVDINGNAASVMIPDNGGFRFGVDAVDFALSPTVLYTNGAGVSSSAVARHYDLQFSTTAIPEPASLGLLSAASLGLMRRRR